MSFAHSSTTVASRAPKSLCADVSMHAEYMSVSGPPDFSTTAIPHRPYPGSIARTRIREVYLKVETLCRARLFRVCIHFLHIVIFVDFLHDFHKFCVVLFGKWDGGFRHVAETCFLERPERAAGCGECEPQLTQVVFYFLRGAISTISETFDDDGRSSRSVRLVGDGIERDITRNTFCNSAVDSVFWHVRFLCRFDECA